MIELLSYSLFVGLVSVCALFVLHPHYPSLRTKLASLVKGEVLSPEKIRATTGGIVTPPIATPPTLQKTALSRSLFVG